MYIKTIISVFFKTIRRIIKFFFKIFYPALGIILLLPVIFIIIIGVSVKIYRIIDPPDPPRPYKTSIQFDEDYKKYTKGIDDLGEVIFALSDNNFIHNSEGVYSLGRIKNNLEALLDVPFSVNGEKMESKDDLKILNLEPEKIESAISVLNEDISKLIIDEITVKGRCIFFKKTTLYQDESDSYVTEGLVLFKPEHDEILNESYLNGANDREPPGYYNIAIQEKMDSSKYVFRCAYLEYRYRDGPFGVFTRPRNT